MVTESALFAPKLYSVLREGENAVHLRRNDRRKRQPPFSTYRERDQNDCRKWSGAVIRQPKSPLQGHTTYRIGVVCYTAPPRQEKRTLLPALCSRFSGKATAQRARRSAPRSDRARPCGDAGFYELPPRKEVRKSHGFPMRRSSFRPIKRKEQNYENKANHNKTRRR